MYLGVPRQGLFRVYKAARYRFRHQTTQDIDTPCVATIPQDKYSQNVGFVIPIGRFARDELFLAGGREHMYMSIL